MTPSARPPSAWAVSTLAGGLALVPLFALGEAIDGSGVLAGRGMLGVAALGFLAGVVVGGLYGGVRSLLAGLTAAERARRVQPW